MTQAMILMGVLVICVGAGVLLTGRPGRTPRPDEPTGSYTAPTKPVSGPPPAVAPTAPPLPATVPDRPSPPLLSAAPPAPPAAPIRRSRNSGFARFAPARTRADRA
jgi:hypothetical protein